MFLRGHGGRTDFQQRRKFDEASVTLTEKSSECNILFEEHEYAQPYLLFKASDPDTPKKHQNVS